MRHGVETSLNMIILDEYVENDYSVIYFHYGYNKDNKPSFGWIKNAYKEFDRK